MHKRLRISFTNGDNFKCNKVKSDEYKINTVLLYRSKMDMFWWKQKESEMVKGHCAIKHMGEISVQEGFISQQCDLRGKAQVSRVEVYVKEFTTLHTSIPNLTDEDMFYFINRPQNQAKTELERRQVSTLDEASIEAEALTNFRHDKHDKGKGKETRSSHTKCRVCSL